MRNITYAFLCMIILPLWPGISMAEKPETLQVLLKGDFRVLGYESCIDSISGFSGYPYWYPCSAFDPATGPAATCIPPIQYESTSIGFASFDGKGNVRTTWESLTTVDNPNQFVPPPGSGFPPPTNFFISAGETECDYTYTVNPDRTFTMQQGSCAGTITTGAAGDQLLITGGEFVGFIARGGQTLVTATVEPSEVTITVGQNTSTRVCSTTSTYYPVSPSSGARADQAPEEAVNLDPRPWW